MGSDIVELIKDIVKYLSSGLVEYFLECRVSDKRQEYFSNKGGKWAKFCFYMSLIVSILLIIIGIVGLVKGAVTDKSSSKTKKIHPIP